MEHGTCKVRRQPRLQQLVDMVLGLDPVPGQQRLHRQGPQGQAHRALAHPVVDHLDHLEAAAAHVAHETGRPVEAGDHAQPRITGLLAAAQHADGEPGLLRDLGCQGRPVARPAHGLGRQHVDARGLHRRGHGLEPAHRLDRAPRPFGRKLAGLVQPFRQPAQGLLVEARERCPAQLVVDHEPDRVRADVDDGIMLLLAPEHPLRHELQGPADGRLILSGRVLVHRLPPPVELGQWPKELGSGRVPAGNALCCRAQALSRPGSPPP